MTCKNCDHIADKNFCANCGQKTEIHGITVRHVLHDFLHAFTHTDKGFFVLIRQLLFRPGIVAREYIEGKRKKYFNPLSFLVITMAVAAYASHESRYFDAFQSGSAPATETVQDKGQLIRQEIGRINARNVKLVGLGVVAPAIAFVSWLLFMRRGYNFAENFVLSSFIYGMSNIVRVLVFIPLHLALPGKIRLIDGAFQIVFLVYLTIAFRQFFRTSWFITILKSILTLVLFIVLYWLVLWIVAWVKVSMSQMD